MDEKIRQLERSAAAGDSEAQLELSRACLRANLGCKFEYHQAAIDLLNKEILALKSRVANTFGSCFIISLRELFNSTDVIDSFEFFWLYDLETQIEQCDVKLVYNKQSAVYSTFIAENLTKLGMNQEEFIEGILDDPDGCEFSFYDGDINNPDDYPNPPFGYSHDDFEISYESLKPTFIKIATLANQYLRFNGETFFRLRHLGNTRFYDVNVLINKETVSFASKDWSANKIFTWDQLT